MQKQLAEQAFGIQKSNNSSPTPLTKQEIANVSEAVMMMSLAKNIKLMDGTTTVWVKCLQKDIDRGLITVQDFIDASEIVTRRPVYNRLDYSDVYREAVGVAHKQVKYFYCDIAKKKLLVDEMAGRIFGDTCQFCDDRCVGNVYCCNSKFSNIFDSINLIAREYAELWER